MYRYPNPALIQPLIPISGEIVNCSTKSLTPGPGTKRDLNEHASDEHFVFRIKTLSLILIMNEGVDSVFDYSCKFEGWQEAQDRLIFRLLPFAFDTFYR
jgi:hypothetical protein